MVRWWTPNLSTARKEVREADVHMMSPDEHASKHLSQCEIMAPLTGCLSPVKASGRTKIGAADEGFDKAYRLLQSLSLWFRRRWNDVPSF